MSRFPYLVLAIAKIACWTRAVLRHHGALVGKLPRVAGIGIRERLVSAFVGVASLTLLASVVALFSYSHIAQSLRRIETEGVAVMNRALLFAREAAEYSSMTSALQTARDKRSLTAAVAKLEAMHDEISATFGALKTNLPSAEALTQLEGSIGGLANSIQATAAAIDRRLTASGRRAELVERAMAAHRAIVEKLAPLLDDADFDLAIGFQSFGDIETLASAATWAKRAENNAAVLQSLSALRAESHIAIGILMEASLSPSIELLNPFRDQYIASSHRARKAVTSVPDGNVASKLRSAFEALLAFGRGGDDLFRARQDELTAFTESSQLVSSSQTSAAALARQVQDSVSIAQRRTAHVVAASYSAIASSRALLILLAVLSVTFAFGFAWIYVGRGLLSRLSKLNEAILALAGGNLEVEIPHGGHDELTRIAAAVEVFKRNAIAARQLEADKERARLADLTRREASFRLLFESNPVPMWVYDRNSLRFLSVNVAAVEHYGYSLEKFLSMTVLDIRPPAVREFVAEVLRKSGGNLFGEETWQHLKSDGTLFEVVAYSRALPYYGTEAALVAVIDITERKRAEARIAHMAHHDALTNLPNRVLLQERLQAALEHAQRHKKGVALLSLDLDRFKEVNDTLGHPIGDALLKSVTERLTGCVKEMDTVARLGGDEFVTVMSVNDNAATEAAALATKIHNSIASPFNLEGHQVTVGATIGIAIAPNDASDPDELLRSADLALCRAKSDGRGTYRFFETEMDRRLQDRRSLEHDLRNALAQGEFELHYQPLVNLARDEICGFEALLRWTHPTRGRVSPAEFVPLAEEIGLIVSIGEWVLRQACSEAATWPDNFKVAVNLSPAQFKCRHLAQTVVNALANAGMAANRLELEITESAMLHDEGAALATLTQLRDLGVRIALDDFGTGYSSLSNLRKFPLDKIKIDRSFVSDLSKANIDALAIVRSVAQLGAALGMATTAEGVETAEQRECVRVEGCTEIQGYFISPAVPTTEIAKFLGKQRSIAA
jgi:diguanylate cyclase (GGDEF)-like protein/PAS domain S-box-containing protein